MSNSTSVTMVHCDSGLALFLCDTTDGYGVMSEKFTDYH